MKAGAAPVYFEQNRCLLPNVMDGNSTGRFWRKADVGVFAPLPLDRA